MLYKKDALILLKSKFMDVNKSSSIKRIKELYKTVKNLPILDTERVNPDLERMIKGI